MTNLSRFFFCDAIISPKTELVNTFSEKNQKNLLFLEKNLENLFTKRKKYGIISPQEEKIDLFIVFSILI